MYDRVSFQPRYRITGVIRTVSPLHIGSGISESRGVTKAGEKKGDPEVDVMVNTVCTTVDRKPFIPGSTLKGVLASWLREHGARDSAFDAVFGKVDDDNHPVSGGKAEFRDAPMTKSAPPPQTGNVPEQRRHWCAARGTCVEPRAAIDPRSRTAGDQRLFHLEYVPEGAEFAVRIDLPMASETELHCLLRSLEAFNAAPHGARLGGEQTGRWGQVTWHPPAVEVVESGDVAAWIASGDFDSLPFRKKVVDPAIYKNLPVSRDEYLALGITLRFNGALLINDPSQEIKNKQDPARSIGHATIRRQDGSFYLPGSSFRGAFRAQAERIWRTLAQGLPDSPVKSDFDHLFGSNGRRSSLEIGDFAIEQAVSHRQEFVAIDRFTGGSADEKKFNANGIMRPVAKGALRAQPLPNWALILLLYTLRDLVEGDVCFGFGRSKGYGHCSAEITCAGAVDPAFMEAVADLRHKKPLSAETSTALAAWHAELMREVAKAKLPDRVQPQVRGA